MDIFLALKRADDRKHPAMQTYGLYGEVPEREDDLTDWIIDGNIDFVSAAVELNKILQAKGA